MATRLLGWFFALAALAASPAAAKEWAAKLFNVTTHDFGVVARGADVEFRFVLDNIYLEDVHVASVTSTCGCTIPTLSKSTLKTYETAELVAQLDTKRFHGRKDATLKVVFDRPFPAEVQLHVYAYIRSDVVFEPGAVHFGSVAPGKSTSQRVNVSYAGRPDWRIVDVTSASKRLAADLRELSRVGDRTARVEYELVVTLRDNAPAGYFKEQVILKTNDPNPQTAEVPLMVEGQVVASVTISPGSLMLGALRPGQSAERTLVARAETPFRVLGVASPDLRFRFVVPKEPKQVQMIPLTFAADARPGRVAGKIRVETDLPGNKVLEVSFDGQIVEPTP